MKRSLIAILLFFNLCSFAQYGDLVFNDTMVHNLYIQTPLVNWFDTLEHDFDQNISNPELYPERYHPCNITWDGIPVNNCGFREKGNASNLLTHFGRKKPLKISFNEYIDREFDGLKKMNLNNFTNDPSLLHDVISFKLMRDAGLLAPRTAFTKVWVNDELIGLYLVIENVDKAFLKLAYGGSGNDGNLYKTDRGAGVSLDWLGSDPDPYKDQGLKLTTNETENDWTRFIQFVDLLNNDHSDNFRQNLESTFDVHSYLKILAVEKCVRSWDSYWGGGNNFFLYEHPDGMIRWIPWDMNETFQDIRVIGMTGVLDGYLVPANKFDERPLLKRLFEIDDYKTEYLNYCCDLIHTNFSLNHLGKYILDRHNLVDAPYQEDPNKYNSYDEFRFSLTDYNQDEVSLTHSGYSLKINYPGIYPFIQSQRLWVVDQMKGWERECVIEEETIYNLFIYPNPSSSEVNIRNDYFAFDYAQYKIYDFSGNLVRCTEYEMVIGDYSTISVEGLPGGIYLLMKISADGKTGRAKMIVR